MESKNLIAKAEININAPIDDVWDALVNPVTINKYMFGTTVTSDWKEGSKITWKGEWKGKPYEDKGYITQLIPGKMIQYTHYSPLSGLPDVPENYTTLVTVSLNEKNGGTHVELTQTNNPDEDAKEHSEENWNMMLKGMKKVVEG